MKKMNEFMCEVEETIERWKDVAPHQQRSRQRIITLRKLVNGLERYTLVQVDLLSTLRAMTEVVKKELERIDG